MGGAGHDARGNDTRAGAMLDPHDMEDAMPVTALMPWAEFEARVKKQRRIMELMAKLTY